ncbi:MAG TPA: isoprenylcysteine carboxylmethyltransferase family protein [Tepidisphaeraceae bacterium]|nr:isoprenylcysteine carboxylmethyltransferase family protein [Tepidisphaeraceae bacterium]
MPLNPGLVSKCISGLWLIFLLYWIVHAFGNKRSTFKQSRSSRLLYLVITTGFVYAIVSIRQLRIPLVRTTLATQLAGIALCASGIGIAIWARRVLGTNWSGIVTLKEGHTLVRRGPYSLVRHPIYSGVLLAAAGSFLAVLPTLQGVICLCFLFVGLRLKSLFEEQVLSRQFPDEYPQYRREVKALVPYVY